MNHKIKKILCVVLMLCQMGTITAYAKPEWPKDTGIQAEAGSLMDVDSGTLIFGQNSHVEYPPASITKILTALIVLEHVHDLSEVVTFSETAMLSVEADSGNKLSLEIGDTMTVEDALHALLLVSVNQSANALAEHVAGSIPAFVDMMNAKLVELGCKESHFENPSGLNGDAQYVSAYDMAKIACAAYSNKTLLRISSTLKHKLGPLKNHPDGITVSQEHRLLITEDSTSPFYYPEAVAGKTGYLIKAGNTLVTYAEKDGRRLVSVILKGSPRQYFVDGKTLLAFGFDSFKNVEIAEHETRYVTGEDTVEIGGSTYQPSELGIQKGRMMTLPKTAEFADADVMLLDLPEECPEGAVAFLQYTYNERKIGQAYLMLKEYADAVPDETESEMANESDTEVEDEDGEASLKEEDTSGEDILTQEAPFGDAQMQDTEVPHADAEAGSNTDVKPQKGLKALPLVLAIAGAVLVLAIAGISFWIVKERKREEREAALRRERRRQRRLEDGIEKEEEFNRLLEERRQRSRR